jgi:hypothetical protein
MKTAVIGVSAVLLGALGATMLPAQRIGRSSEGSELYTPSKVEWVVVNVNSLRPTDLASTMQYSLSCYARDPTENEIVIHVRYDKAIDAAGREHMKRGIKATHDILDIYAKRSGFEWIKVREDVQPY